MRRRLVVLVTLLGIAAPLVSALAAVPEPAFVADPFADAPWTGAPLVSHRRLRRAQRFVATLALGQSLDADYFAARGIDVALGYAASEALTLSLGVGYVLPGPSALLRGRDGALAARLDRCLAADPTCRDATPNLEGAKPWSGVVEARLAYAPLYGKLTASGDWDVPVRLGVTGGVGVHGTRTVRALASAADPEAAIALQGIGLGEGGFLERPALHFVLGGALGVGLTTDVLVDVEVVAVATPSDAGVVRPTAKLGVEVLLP